MEEQSKKFSENCTSNSLNIDRNAKSISELNELVIGLSTQITKLIAENDRNPHNNQENVLIPNDNTVRNVNRNFQFSTRLTKVEFPKFGGVGLKPWLYKCAQFFELDEIADPNRVKLAAIHLEDKALLWHQTYMKNRGYVAPKWEEYVKDISARFGDLYDDPMADLKELKQLGSVQEYHDSFDALASRLNLNEEYLLSCYMGGLEEEIKLAVRMFGPKTLQQAHCLAKLQEASLNAKKGKLNHKPALLPTPNTNRTQINPSMSLF